MKGGLLIAVEVYFGGVDANEFYLLL